MPSFRSVLLGSSLLLMLTASLSANAFEGDAEKGKRLFLRCKACHNLSAAERPRIGPNLNDLFGRAAGKQEGFNYSKALVEADFVWDEEKLDQWLANPKTFLPGNRMTFPGLRKDTERADIIAYLKEATKSE